jgi:hypothetical protein
MRRNMCGFLGTRLESLCWMILLAATFAIGRITAAPISGSMVAILKLAVTAMAAWLASGYLASCFDGDNGHRRPINFATVAGGPLTFVGRLLAAFWFGLFGRQDWR